MASALQVERLFALPYFRQMFAQVVKPLTDTISQTMSITNNVDAATMTLVTEEAYKYIYHGMTKLLMDFYADILTDEDVAFLYETYQHPTILKLQAEMQHMTPMLVSWYANNHDLIMDSIKAALDQAP